jgi:predicted membrane channel-forming protein YqfA (hemolysin III family)
LLLHKHCKERVLLLGSTTPIERVTAYSWHLMRMMFAIDNVS